MQMRNSRELETLISTFREVNERNTQELQQAKTLHDMVQIRIKQPPLSDLSKRKVRLATNQHPWSYGGQCTPSHTLPFKTQTQAELKSRNPDIAGLSSEESDVKRVQRITSGPHFFEAYDDIMKAEEVSSTEEMLRQDDLKLALKRIVKRMPPHKYKKEELKPPPLNKHFLGNKYAKLRKRAFKEDQPLQPAAEPRQLRPSQA